MDPMDELLAKYIFMKTGGFDPGIQEEMVKEAAKPLVGQGGVGGGGGGGAVAAGVAAGWLADKIMNLFGKGVDLAQSFIPATVEVGKSAWDALAHQLPAMGLGLGGLGGASWWMLNREIEKEKAKQRKRMAALQRQIDKAKEMEMG